jgi:sporulation protein YlmC with PRC-barrel domain
MTDTEANVDTALWEIEQQYWTSGEGFFRENLADPTLTVLPDGVLDRGQTLALIGRRGKPWSRVELAERHAVWPTPEVVVLSYRAAAWRGEGEPAYEARVSSVHVQREGEWRRVFHQQHATPPLLRWQQSAMLFRASRLTGAKVEGNDGPIGTVSDIYFDDERWGVRHLVVRTGDWLEGREVLLSPHQLLDGALGESPLRVTLTRDQVRDAPAADTDQPVSRHYEAALARYYRYPYYWTGPMLWGDAMYPGVAPLGVPTELGNGAPDATLDELRDAELEAARRCHLRSAEELRGYHVEASDGDAGKLVDVLIDVRSWSLSALIVDTHPWWFGGKVLLPPAAVQSIDWAGRAVRLGLSRDALKRQPAADGPTIGG